MKKFQVKIKGERDPLILDYLRGERLAKLREEKNPEDWCKIGTDWSGTYGQIISVKEIWEKDPVIVKEKDDSHRGPHMKFEQFKAKYPDKALLWENIVASKQI